MECYKEIKTFLDGEGRLTAFPAKRKKKIIALFYLAERWNRGNAIPSGRSTTCSSPGTFSGTPPPCAGSFTITASFAGKWMEVSIGKAKRNPIPKN